MTCDLRVLFVGNSCTYFNDLPRMVAGLVPGLRFQQITKGGQGLLGHALDSDVQWMITGVGSGTCRLSDGLDFFSDGQGWDVLVLQDRADTVREALVDDTKLEESLAALDAIALSVHTATERMRRKPTVALFHRAVWDRSEFDEVNDVAEMSEQSRTVMQLYVDRLVAALGPSIPVFVLPVHNAYEMVHAEDHDVFSRLYAGDGAHPSRLGSYLAALLLSSLLTGESVVGKSFRPTDADGRLHVEMWGGPETWCPSDAWHRAMWPDVPLPELDDGLARRMQVWADRVVGRTNTNAPFIPTARELADQWWDGVEEMRQQVSRLFRSEHGMRLP